MDGFIYLLESINSDKRYLGSSINPNDRIASHNKGFTESTKNDRPWKCLMVVNVGTIEETRRIEKYIKTQKEKLTVNNVIKFINRFCCNRFDLDI